MRSKSLLGVNHSALEERVFGLAADVAGVKQDVHELRSVMASRADVVALSTKFDEFLKSQKTQWQPIWTAAGVMLAVSIAVGGLAYRPVIQEQAEIKAKLEGDFYMTRRETEKRWEWSDERYAELKKRVGDLEDQVSKSFTVKDAVKQLQDRIDRVQGVVTEGLLNNKGERTNGSP